MPLWDFDQLHQHATAREEPVPVAVVGGEDRTVLEALRAATDHGWIRPRVTGSATAMRALAERHEIGLEDIELVDTCDIARDAVREVRRGAARMLMKGQVPTPELMAAVLDPNEGLRTERVISQVVLMQVLAPHRRFLLADTGICVRPSLLQKQGILRNAVEIARTLGEPVPRVAMMAATETVTEKMPETIEAREIVSQVKRTGQPTCLIDGPLSFDMAYSLEAAQKKSAANEVTGEADVMIFPDLLSANLTVKAIMYTADCHFGGVLAGVACPVVFMSRADSTQTRLDSLAFALQIIASPIP